MTPNTNLECRIQLNATNTNVECRFMMIMSTNTNVQYDVEYKSRI